MTVRQRHGLETLFDALVHAAQALLEPEHLLADDLEAEVAGLDDARVHRTHRNFVDAVAFDRTNAYCSSRAAISAA
jgi:hypothetical protein